MKNSDGAVFDAIDYDTGELRHLIIKLNKLLTEVIGHELLAEVLLSDETSRLYGLDPETSTPDQVFRILANGSSGSAIDSTALILTNDSEALNDYAWGKYGNVSQLGSKLALVAHIRNNAIDIGATFPNLITCNTIDDIAGNSDAKSELFSNEHLTQYVTMSPFAVSKLGYFYSNFKGKGNAWTEGGGTFQYTENGLYVPHGDTKGTINGADMGVSPAIASTYQIKYLEIPLNISSLNSLRLDITIDNTVNNSDFGGIYAHLVTSDNEIVWQNAIRDTNASAKQINFQGYRCNNGNVIGSTGITNTAIYNNVKVKTEIKKTQEDVQYYTNDISRGVIVSDIPEKQISKILICCYASTTTSYALPEITVHSLEVK